MFEVINDFFERVFSWMFKPESPRIVVQPELRVNDCGRIYMVRVPREII